MIQSSLANLLHGFTLKLPRNISNEELNKKEVFKLANQGKSPLEFFISSTRTFTTSLQFVIMDAEVIKLYGLLLFAYIYVLYLFIKRPSACLE